MTEGTIKFYNTSRGFGFIEVDGMEQDVFFHVDDLGGQQAHEGQRVTFEMSDGPRGPRASGISLPSSAPPG